MNRTAVSPEEIRELVDARLNAEPEVMKGGVQIKVPLPEANAPDQQGCNWHMKFGPDAVGYEATVSRVMADIRGEYSMKA